MAEWWESAPVAPEAQQEEDWYSAAPLADEAPAQPNSAAAQLDDFYSSGIYAGAYNPLGAIARALDASVSAGGDVLTSGWGDELSGLMGMDTHAIRQRNDALRESNPIASTVGSVGGALALGSSLGKALPSNMAAGSGLGIRMAAGGGEGLALGALYGSGDADEGSRLGGAAMGGLVGGATGALFPLVAAGVGRGYEAIRNAWNAKPIAAQAGISPETARALGGIIEADGALGPQGQAAMRRAGPEAMLVDSGPTAQGVLDTTIQRGGPGARVAREAIDARLGRDSQALVSALDDALGTPQGVATAQNAIRQAAKPEVTAAYNKAYSTPIDYASDAGRKVEDIINRIPDRIKSGAIQRANERMFYDGRTNMQILADIADDGKVTFRQLPSVEQADYIKRALNEIVNDGTDITGKMSADAQFASQMAKDLRNAVADAVPVYGEALKTAADPLSEQAAIKLGSKLLSRGMVRDEAAMAIRGMTEPEKRAVAQGIRSQIDEAMANVQRTATDPNIDARAALDALKKLSSPANREKTALVIGQQKSKALFDELDRVAQSFELRSAVSTNSRTFGRGAISERVKDLSGADGPVRTALRGEPVNASKRVIQALTGETPARQAAREDQTYLEIARLLTRQGGAGQDVYDAISKIGQTDAATKLMRDTIVRALSGPQYSYPLAVESVNRR
jgi:hypothetical protein